MLRLVLLALTLAAAPAAAETRDEIVHQMGREGYTSIRVQRTWLGRERIVATGPAGTREVVLNPSTGEVLRDLVAPAEAPAAPSDGEATRGLTIAPPEGPEVQGTEAAPEGGGSDGEVEPGAQVDPGGGG